MARDTRPGSDPRPQAATVDPAGADEQQGAPPAANPLRNTDDDPNVIVCAVDSSNGANRVLSMSARLARAFPAAALHVAHVFRTSRFDRAHAAAPAPNADALADAKEHLEFQVRSARAQCRNDVTGHFQVGDPTTEILRMVSELKAQLLVIGTHDNAGFERLILGSTAETLMRKAGCSVFVVRPDKFH
jgi:nucleotide-binding universal stress UspA family protein